MRSPRVPWRWVVGLLLLGAGGWWLAHPTSGPDGSAGGLPSLAQVERYVVAGLVVASLLVGLVAWWRWRARRRAEALIRLGDAIARETHTDPSRIKIKVRRWSGLLPVAATCRYSSLFDDGEGSRDRERVEELLARKVGRDLDIDWTPHRDTVRWRPTSNSGDSGLEVGTVDPTAVAPRATRWAVVERLDGGLAAVLGASVDVEVTAWHGDNVPQSFAVTFPASARVHEDKIQDAVEDKVSTLLPGTWRAEWRTNDDRVVFTDRPDPLAPVVNAPPLPQAADLSALPMGMSESGQPWTVRLSQTHVLIGGASGAGKGSVLWSLIRAVSPAVADGSVRLWGIDPKGGMELGRGRGAFERFATDITDAEELLEAAVRFMRTRAKRLADSGSRKHEPQPGDPMLIVVIDEIATLTKYGADKRTKDAINASLGLLLSQGRAVGVCIVGALQDPRKDVLALRDLFPTRIALRLNEPNAPDMVLGAGARTSGARADRIPVEHAGVGYMMVDGSPTPERFRAAWISDDAIDELVALCRRNRDAVPALAAPLGPETVSVDDLAEGDRVLVDEDGTEHEVTVMAPPCESADDETIIEVDYRHDDGRVGMIAVDDSRVFHRVAVATPR